jgi:hypothetical protein
MTPNERVCAVALWTILVALLVVGVVSATMIRHAVQVLPLLAGSLIVMVRPAWGRFAALPLFLFWLGLMVVVWLYLLGWTHIISGTFPAAEIGLTVVIGLACLVGLGTTAYNSGPTPWWLRVVLFLLFGLLQVGAMWLSMQPGLANR